MWYGEEFLGQTLWENRQVPFSTKQSNACTWVAATISCTSNKYAIVAWDRPLVNSPTVSSLFRGLSEKESLLLCFPQKFILFTTIYNIKPLSYINTAVIIFLYWALYSEFHCYRNPTQWLSTLEKLPTCIYWRTRADHRPQDHFHHDQSCWTCTSTIRTEARMWLKLWVYRWTFPGLMIPKIGTSLFSYLLFLEGRKSFTAVLTT
jgi:hypothetical protein